MCFISFCYGLGGVRCLGLDWIGLACLAKSTYSSLVSLRLVLPSFASSSPVSCSVVKCILIYCVL